MRTRECEKALVEGYVNRIADSLNEIDKVVEALQKENIDIYIGDPFAMIVDECIRIRLLYGIDKEKTRHGNCK